MKRHGNLFNRIIDMENLLLAHDNARRGKTHYRDVKMVDLDPMKYVKEIQRMLKDQSYQVGDYDIITRKVDSGKVRTIFRLGYFPHRIIHHAIVQVMEPIWVKSMIADTYCCIKGRGIHKAAKKLARILREDEAGTAYCLKIDIKKYYPSVDHDILKKVIRRKIKDQRLLALLDQVIDSAPGLPIGNYLSQYFANLYLNDFDHYIKETLRVRYYFRYCDDIVILGADKEYLREIFRHLVAFLDSIKLTVKENHQIFPVKARGIDFLGYRFFHGYTLLRKRIAKKVLKLSRSIEKAGRITDSQYRSLLSYYGWLKYGNCLNLRRKVYNDNIFRIVAHYTSDLNLRNPLQGLA